MRVRINGLAWLDKREMETKKVFFLKRSLTIMPRQVVDFGDDKTKEIRLYEERDNLLGIPRGFYYKFTKFNNAIEDCMCDGRHIDLEYKGMTTGKYKEQSRAVKVIKDKFSNGLNGGVVQASPAWGKTAMALRLVADMKCTSFVIVHRDFLINQWTNRINQFLPGARVGIVKQDIFDIENKDIVICLVQSIAKRDYGDKLKNFAGLVIFDETHRIPAYTWAKVPAKFNARYRLGLTATPRRADGTDNIIWWSIGDIIYKAKNETNKPKLKRIFTKWNLPPILAAKELKLPTVLKFLIKNNDRNYKIIDQVFQAVCSKSQRKVIILSDRLEHLKILQEILNKEANKHKIQVTSDFYIGARRKDELDEAVKAQVIFATYSMAQEALDIPAIDTLMLVTPRSDVEQAIGRIRRWCIPENGKCTKDLCMWKRDTCKGKPQTIIVDFIDDERNCQKKFASRMFLYRKLGISIGTE